MPVLRKNHEREIRSSPNDKRRRTDNALIFSKPFRPENYRQHHTRQHPVAWDDYQNSPARKKSFFDKDKEFSLHSFLDLSSEKLNFKVKGGRVDIVILPKCFFILKKTKRMM
jgi:hypothetical protein